MLDPVYPWGRKVRPFCAKEAKACVAREPWQIREHFRLRREIFCEEQRVFAETDRDDFDRDAVPIVALCSVYGVSEEVVGVVRIYPTEQGVWFGGRLGVASSHRRVGTIGTALITCAVSSAHAAGCTQFLATVQDQNVKYFERHDFSVRERIELYGRPHALMEARLSSYPPELAASPVAARNAGHARAA